MVVSAVKRVCCEGPFVLLEQRDERGLEVLSMAVMNSVVVSGILAPSSQVHRRELGDEVRLKLVPESTNHPPIVQAKREDTKHDGDLHEVRNHLDHEMVVDHMTELVVDNGNYLLVGLRIQQSIKEYDFTESPEPGNEGI